MEITDISQCCRFEIRKEKSERSGVVYQGLYLVIYDKDKNVIYKHLVRFLPFSHYDNILSCSSK